MDHLIDASRSHRCESRAYAERRAGHRDRGPEARRRSCGVVKFVAYGWSGERSLPAVRDQVDAALLARPGHTGWDGLLAEQRQYLDDFWDRADVEVDGDAEIQQAVRFALFHVLQAGARAENRAIPAKGLTGPGYDGHAFWDTEIVRAAGAHLHRPGGRRATPCAGGTAPCRWPSSGPPSSGLEGAAFPWRTIHGEECSGYWPASTAAFHVNADIADAVIRYVGPPATTPFDADRGLELLVADRAAVALARPPRRPGAVPHRRGHRARRVQRDRRQQRLHQPDGPAEPASPPPMSRNGYPTRPASSGSTREECASWRDAADADVHPLRRGARRPPAVGGLHQPRRSGTSPPPTASSTRCCCTSPTSTCTASRSSSRPTWSWRMHLRGDAFTAGAEGPQLRLLRGAHRPGLVAVGLHPGGHRGRGRPPGAGLRLPRRGRPDRPRRPRAQHPRRPAHRLPGRHLDRAGHGLRRPAPRRCQVGFAPRLPDGLARIAFCLVVRGSGCASRLPTRRPRTP